MLKSKKHGSGLHKIWRVAVKKHYPPDALQQDELGLGEGEVKALRLRLRDVEVEVEVPVVASTELCLLSMDSAFLPSSKANPKVSARRKINRIAKP